MKCAYHTKKTNPKYNFACHVSSFLSYYNSLLLLLLLLYFVHFCITRSLFAVSFLHWTVHCVYYVYDMVCVCCVYVSEWVCVFNFFLFSFTHFRQDFNIHRSTFLAYCITNTYAPITTDNAKFQHTYNLTHTRTHAHTHFQRIQQNT